MKKEDHGYINIFIFSCFSFSKTRNKKYCKFMIKKVKIADPDEPLVIEQLDFDRQYGSPREFFLPFIRERDGCGRLIGSQVTRPSIPKSRAKKMMEMKFESPFKNHRRLLSNLCQIQKSPLPVKNVKQNEADSVDYSTHPSYVWVNM
jgi:hypothetical protein